MAKAQQIDLYRKPDSLVRGLGGMTDADLYAGAVAAVRVIRVAAPSFICEQFGCGLTQANRLLDLMVENRLGILRRSFRGSLFEYQSSLTDEVDYRGPRVQESLPLGYLPPEGKPTFALAQLENPVVPSKHNLEIGEDDARMFAIHLRAVIDGIAPNDREQRLSKSVLTTLYLCLTENRAEVADADVSGLAMSNTRF